MGGQAFGCGRSMALLRGYCLEPRMPDFRFGPLTTSSLPLLLGQLSCIE
jgi:hypothetical protein